MRMDEFIKKLYDFKGIIEFFGVKIVIELSKNHYDLILIIEFDLSQNNRYISDIFDILSIYFRYILIFFLKFQYIHV